MTKRSDGKVFFLLQCKQVGGKESCLLCAVLALFYIEHCAG